MISTSGANWFTFIRPSPRLSRWRLLLLGVLTFAGIHFVFLSRSESYYLTAAPRSLRRAQKLGRLIPYAVLNRGHSTRDTELAAGRETLEYWWSVMHDQHKATSEACPLSIAGPPPPEKTKDRRYDFFIRQAIDIMEAMGFSNLTTCYGRYPRLANVAPYRPTNASRSGESSPLTHNVVFDRTRQPPARPHDKIGKLLAQTRIFLSDEEDLIKRKFCYTPSFRPQQVLLQARPEHSKPGLNGSQGETVRPKSDPQFCQKLLKLYRAIQAGTEPPLLTLFTWLPDVLDDPVKDLRRLMLLNMDQFRPFVQPVLLSDRRMVMALANGLSWPCLPVREFSPDHLPVFEPASSEVGKTFNSTFYGYVHRVSLLDASLLETLLAVRDNYLTGTVSRLGVKQASKSLGEGEKDLEQPENIPGNRRDPGVLLYGSAMYVRTLGTVKNHSNLGTVAHARRTIDLNSKEPFPAYVIYNSRVNFTDLPPVKLDDQYLIPLLASRSRALGHVVVEASNTVLSLYTVSTNTLSEWGRKYPVSVPRNGTYNRLLADQYLKSLKQGVNNRWKGVIQTNFHKNGNILFREL